MNIDLLSIANSLLPALRACCGVDYGIALGGAHAKGTSDSASDLDLYVFAREIVGNDARSALMLAANHQIHGVSSWAYPGVFSQAGTDFALGTQRVEVWFRHIDQIAATIRECQDGSVKQELVTWTVMGFFNHCTLSDVSKMQVMDDPLGILSAWQADVRLYPPKLRKAIIERHMSVAHFWPRNFHYESAVNRADVIYAVGIVQQTAHNLIQVLFAANEVYFPGEKKMQAALDKLPIKPERLVDRMVWLLAPGVSLDVAVLREQRAELISLVDEVQAIADRS